MRVKDAEQAAFEAWLEAKRPYGDCEAVQCAWAKSQERAEFLEGQADAPAAEAAAWRNGKDVKEEERTGLWHMRFPGDPVTTSAYAASDLTFTDPDTLYRRAAPGTNPGDPYREEAYAGVAG